MCILTYCEIDFFAQAPRRIELRQGAKSNFKRYW